ncbi:hypothetical protein Tco_0601218 [Tanacetum coccineum]
MYQMKRLKTVIESTLRFMEKIQEVLPAESSSTDTPLEQVQNNDEKNVFANERQHSEKHAAECADELVNQKHDELVKKSLLTRSQFEGQLKEKSKVISDLKGWWTGTGGRGPRRLREQSVIQTNHCLAHLNAQRIMVDPTFANPKYLKIAQSEKPHLYEIPYDTSDPANNLSPNGRDTELLKMRVDLNWLKTK